MGCGKKGDLRAPRAVVPEKVETLSAHPQGEAVVVSFSMPRKNRDGSELIDLKGFKLLRSVQPLDSACRECPKKFSLLYDIDYESYLLNKPGAATVEYRDSDLSERTIYTYSVVSYNAARQLSPETRTREIIWDVPALPPGKLQARLDGKSVILSWEEPVSLADGGALQGVVGYNLYRRGPGEAFPLTPLNQEPITTLACRDRGVAVDQDYFYTLRSVRKVEETLIESEGCPAISVSTTDYTPPDVPTGLIVLPTTEGIVLKWNDSKAPDRKGYHLYRRTGDAGDFVKVTPAPLPVAGYLDRSVEHGQTYAYTVTALDDAKEANESTPSAPVTIRYNQ